MAKKKAKKKEHGLRHDFVWVHQAEDSDACTRICYEDTMEGADVVCSYKGCGLVVPGHEYIGVVEKMRQFLHLGEDEHINRLQEMLEIIALKYEHEPRLDVGDRTSKST